MTPAVAKIWKVSRAFRYIGSGTTPKSGEPDYYENGSFNWLITGDLNDGEIVHISKSITPKAIADYPTLKLYPAGSVVIAMYGATIAKVGLLTQPTTVNQACCVLVPDGKILPRYAFYYFLSSKRQLIDLGVGGGQPNISQDIVRSFKIALPIIEEQQKMVNFLDEKTAIIDKMITAKNHTHTQLLELRQAIIQNLSLGRGAGMKMKRINSWVGEVPEHWSVTKLSHVAQIKTGGTPNRDNLDYWTNGDIPWLASGEVDKEIISTVDSHITPLGMANSNATILPVDTVMIALNGQGKTKGMAALLKTPATCNQSLAGIICDKKRLVPEYLYYYLKGKYADIRGLKGEARDGLNLDIIGSIPIALPPIEEQKKIIERIENEISKIDKTRDKLQVSTKLLEEYRSSLISNVVGGKVEV